MEQSKKGEVLYRKVSVKERQPKESNMYTTNEGRRWYGAGTFTWHESVVHQKHDTYVAWWLEEVELSSLIESRMPTEGEIDRETDRQSVLYRIGFKDAIKYLKTQLTSKP